MVILFFMIYGLFDEFFAFSFYFFGSAGRAEPFIYCIDSGQGGLCTTPGRRVMKVSFEH